MNFIYLTITVYRHNFVLWLLRHGGMATKGRLNHLNIRDMTGRIYMLRGTEGEN